MVDERENIRPPEKSLTPGVKPDAKVVAPVAPQKDVPIGFGIVTPEIERYRAMIAKDPSSRVFAALAELYRKAGMLDEAVRLCLNGTKAHPKYMSGRVSLARAYFDKGMIKEAKEEVLTVVSITPDNILANKILGDILLLEGDSAGAGESFMKVLALAPDDAEAKQKLLEAQKGPKKSGSPQGRGEDILDAEIVEEIGEADTSEIIEDAVPVEEGDAMITEEAPTPARRGVGPITGTEKIDETADLDIPLEDDGSLDDLFTDELAEDTRDGEDIRESSTEVGGEGPGSEDRLWEVEKDNDRSEPSVGYAPDTESESGSDRQTDDSDIDIEGDQDLTDEFGIMEEDEGDITVEGLENGRGPIRPASGALPKERPTIGSGKHEAGQPGRAMEQTPEGKGDTLDAQGITITTETIADIYVKQGYFDKALAVYEELLGAYPTRDSLKQKIAFVKNKMREMTGDDQHQAMTSIDRDEKTAAMGLPDVADDERLHKNVESLNHWLFSIRKLRRS
jgi:tetratricopeptide (TPR) repeat protein